MVVGGVAMSGPARTVSPQSADALSQNKKGERERELSGNNNGGHLVV